MKSRFCCYNDDMPFLSDLLTKLKKPGAAAAAFFRNLPGTLSALRKPSAEPDAGGKGFWSGRFSPERRKWLLVGLGALLVLLLLSLVAALLIQGRQTRPGPPPEDPAGPVQEGRIPREELFLPEEPDFIPGVLPDRERRNFWTPEDAAPYWQDPLKYGEEPWREQAESVIDELLERVP
jgi:hypothetical protein